LKLMLALSTGDLAPALEERGIHLWRSDRPGGHNAPCPECARGSGRPGRLGNVIAPPLQMEGHEQASALGIFAPAWRAARLLLWPRGHQGHELAQETRAPEAGSSRRPCTGARGREQAAPASGAPWRLVLGPSQSSSSTEQSDPGPLPFRLAL
jgi:hypothetical protein